MYAEDSRKKNGSPRVAARARRRAIRVASRQARRAWLALAGTLVAGCASGSPEQTTGEAPLAERAAQLLAQAIRVRTANPPGDERPLAAYFAQQLRAAGVESRVVKTPPGASPVGRAAAWGRLRGSGRQPPLLLVSHLDVVPADPAAWEVDPFAGARRGGFVIGRGALDAKGISVVHLLAMLELARRGRPLARDLVFLATPDEEDGGREGAGWIVRERPELLLGAEYVLTEGGSILPASARQPAVWGVAVTEKSPCWLQVVAHGTPGHSAAPPRDAAVPRLLAALERVLRLPRELRVAPEVARMFATLAPIAPAEDATGFEDLAAGLERDPAFRRRFLAQRSYGALVRNSVAITVLEGASRTNALPLRATAHVDARLIPGESCERFRDAIRRSIADPGVSVEALLSFPSRSSPVDTALYRAIQRVAAARDPEAVVVPRVTSGFTDAHYFREVDIVAYGFVPRWLPPEEAHRIHGPNERISLANLERGVSTLVAILEELDRSDRSAASP